MAAVASHEGFVAGLASRAARHAAGVVGAALIFTAVLAVPFLAMAPDEFASQEPDGAVFDARDAIEERFGGGVVGWFFIVEARDGELLDRDGLLAVQERADALRADPDHASLLLRRTDPATGAEVHGVVSLADAVDEALMQAGLGGLEGADDTAVRTAVGELIDAQGMGEVGVSASATRDASTGWWSAPAITLSVLADASRIEGRGSDAGFGSDTAVEEVGRRVQAVLRDNPALQVWGVALDQNLTAAEQGEAAGPFIGLTVMTIVLLVGVAFRSYWTLAVVGGALAALLVWLQGIANLVGLKEDQILSTVVPIAMIAFGVDYAFHAVGRWREERGGAAPRRALARGLAGVAPALLLAFATGALAFLANTASGIESTVQFGIAAAIALAAAFVVLGVVVPLALLLVEERVAGRPGRRSRALAVAGGLGAAATAMAAVLLLVFLSPPAGLALLVGYLLAFVVVPAWVVGRRPRTADGVSAALPEDPGNRVGRRLGQLVGAIAVRRAVVLPAAALLSAAAAVGAVQVPASFDVEDFFAADTDFVIALDLLDEHVADQGGEPADVLITSDLSDPAVQAVVAGFSERVAALDTGLLAHDAAGQVRVDDRALGVLEGTSPLNAVEVAQVVAPPADGGLAAARLGVGLVGSRAQENVETARDLLSPLVTELEAELAALHPGSQATLTGTPFVRLASLEAISRSLRVSVPIAVLLCLLCAWAAMRSLRYALASMVPILLVVAWLYGFMYVAGFSVNLVTATIGAISIGIGIDFATHMTMRYREELTRLPTRLDALRAATAGTGVALVGSAVSSAAGFTILAFAPMPMFAGYGLLTAVMICLALLATLLVLPALLLMVSTDPPEADALPPMARASDAPVEAP